MHISHYLYASKDRIRSHLQPPGFMLMWMSCILTVDWKHLPARGQNKRKKIPEWNHQFKTRVRVSIIYLPIFLFIYSTCVIQFLVTCLKCRVEEDITSTTVSKMVRKCGSELTGILDIHNIYREYRIMRRKTAMI